MIIRIYRVFIAILSLLLISHQAIAATNQLLDFRTATTGNKTRLVLEFSAPPDYILFNLSNPQRLVLDIKNTSFNRLPKQAQKIKNTPIKNLRTRFYNGYERVVMDLKYPCTSQSFILPNAKVHRLVIDIQPNVTVANQSAQSPQLAVLPPPTLPQVNNPQPQPILTAAQKVAQGRNIIIVIDPGHGGKDPGTTGSNGVHEKDVVLAISKYLQQDLNDETGFDAELTRRGDYFIPLRGRLDIARQDKADMFVAVHADAYTNHYAMGASVYALSGRGATSEAARWLAEKENKSELLGGASLPDNDNVLRSVLIDLSQTNTISESLQIGSAVLQQLGSVTALHHARVEQAAFVVLKSPDIPSLLVETGFLSTPRQEQQLRDSRYQQLIASAIAQGIKSYFVRNPPQGTMLSAQRLQNVVAAGN